MDVTFTTKRGTVVDTFNPDTEWGSDLSRPKIKELMVRDVLQAIKVSKEWEADEEEE